MIGTIEEISDTVTLLSKRSVKSKHRNEAARSLLREWRNDESGYDEKAWPQAKEIIEQNRLSVRRKFGD